MFKCLRAATNHAGVGVVPDAQFISIFVKVATMRSSDHCRDLGEVF